MTNLTLSARAIFANDRYATECTGVVIDLVEPGYARCSLDILPQHRNAMGGVMGGVFFTLADLAFAAAANTQPIQNGEQLAWVSLNSSIQYLAQPKGQRLSAETSCFKQGRTTCVYNILIRDEHNNLTAMVTTSGMRIN